jgi:hypothetical protein
LIVFVAILVNAHVGLGVWWGHRHLWRSVYARPYHEEKEASTPREAQGQEKENAGKRMRQNKNASVFLKIARQGLLSINSQRLAHGHLIEWKPFDKRGQRRVGIDGQERILGKKMKIHKTHICSLAALAVAAAGCMI